jgi:hypothetical protein
MAGMRDIGMPFVEEKRQAVVVGINNYKDQRILGLKGAENDANDIHYRLGSKSIGNFFISDEHFLIGEEATFNKIRKAISDIFWQTDAGDLSLFYFSGHGFVDGYGNGYIAPYDISVDEPFVCGLNMDDLRRVLINSTKKSVVMILDCCHSGISTKTDKSIPKSSLPYEQYFSDFSMGVGEGKFILASSEADEESRESEFEHKTVSGKHHHGILSYYLIEGLDGLASKENGMVTLSGLKDYAEKQVQAKSKQKPKFFASESSGLNYINMAISPKIYGTFIGQRLETARESFNRGTPESLILSTENISQLLEVDQNHQEAIAIRDEIDEKFRNFEDSIIDWLIEHSFEISSSIPQIDAELKKIATEMCYEKITKMDKSKKVLVANLCSVSQGIIEMDFFVKTCKRMNKPSINPKLSLNIKNNIIKKLS